MVSLRPMSDIFLGQFRAVSGEPRRGAWLWAGAEIGPDGIFPAAQGCLSIAVPNYRISGSSAANSLIPGKC